MENPLGNQLPLIKPPREPEIIEPEIVGHSPPASFWKRILSRAILAGFTALLGLSLAAAGLMLTLTIVGALIGLPLIGLGLILVVFSVGLALGRGRVELSHSPVRLFFGKLN